MGCGLLQNGNAFAMKRTNNMKRGGSVMSKSLREEVGIDPEYSRCALQGLQFGACGGRVTREHSLIHAERKIQERWAIIPCCAAHHGVDFFQDAPTEAPKDVRVWVALNRATDDELRPFSRVINYIRERARLNEKFGVYVPPPIPAFAEAPVLAPLRKRAPVDAFEREVRAYARDTGCSLEESRETLQSLV